MSLTFILSILQIIVSFILIVVVLMQPGKTNGFSGIMSSGSGSSESFYSKNKSRTSEARLVRITIVCALIFAALSLAQNFISK